MGSDEKKPASRFDGQVTVDLVGRIKGGDKEAFDNLFHHYIDKAKLIVRFKLGPHLRQKVESMDILQEAYLEAYRQFEKFEPGENSSFHRWLSTIIHNKINEHYERYFKVQKRDVRREVSLAERVRGDGQASTDLGSMLPADQTTPSVVVNRKDQLAILEQALDRLPEDYRRVLILWRFEERPIQEIAKEFDRSEAACRMLIVRATKALADEMKRLTSD